MKYLLVLILPILLWAGWGSNSSKPQETKVTAISYKAATPYTQKVYVMCIEGYKYVYVSGCRHGGLTQMMLLSLSNTAIPVHCTNKGSK